MISLNKFHEALLKDAKAQIRRHIENEAENITQEIITKHLARITLNMYQTMDTNQHIFKAEFEIKKDR